MGRVVGVVWNDVVHFCDSYRPPTTKEDVINQIGEISWKNHSLLIVVVGGLTQKSISHFSLVPNTPPLD